jgi:DNA-binding transcriptional regulator YiaG
VKKDEADTVEIEMILQMYQYSECGLDYIYLANGFDYVTSPAGKAIVIQDVDGLHEAIGRFLLRERATLGGAEIRFVRHELGLSQSSLACNLGVTEQTVRRWEQDRQSLPKTADAVLRLMYSEKFGGNEKVSNILKRMADLEDEIDRRVVLEESDDVWDVREAA